MWRKGFKAFFEGDFEKTKAELPPFHRLLIGLEHHLQPMLDADSFMSIQCAEWMWWQYPLGKNWVAVLKLAESTGLSDEHADKLKILCRCHLVDEHGQLTQAGRYKLIASLPLKEQVELLSVPYKELHAPAIEGKSTEDYVIDKYSALGYECRHDEGAYICMLADFSLKSDIPAMKKLLAHDPIVLENKHFCEAVGLGTFKDIIVDGELTYSDSSRSALLEMVSRTTHEIIKRGYKAWHDEKTMYWGTESTRMDLDFLLKVFDCLGANQLVQLTALRLDGHAAWGGWPDVTAIKDGRIALIESKRTDTLMFNQARTIDTIRKLPGGIFSDIRVEKVVLI